MRVFVTGATGFIGSATAQELLGAGHQVLGLARNDAAEAALKKVGVEPHRGDLKDVESLIAGAKACDGVIHLGFVHDWSDFAANIAIDLTAVKAMAGALEGTDKPMVIASGTLMISHLRPATEEGAPLSPEMPRAGSEEVVRTARGVRGAVVRLPPTVHGAGDHGFVPRMIELARAKGSAAYVGDGSNRWPAVHRLDAARVFCLALEKAAPGSNLHAVAEEGVPTRAIAEAIGAGLGLPARSVTPEEAPAHLDFLATFFAMDNPTTSVLTRERLGWSPREPDLLTDIPQNYFP